MVNSYLSLISTNYAILYSPFTKFTITSFRNTLSWVAHLPNNWWKIVFKSFCPSFYVDDFSCLFGDWKKNLNVYISYRCTIFSRCLSWQLLKLSESCAFIVHHIKNNRNEYNFSNIKKGSIRQYISIDDS